MGDEKTYLARFNDPQPGGFVFYSAAVTEFSAAALKEYSIKDLMLASVSAFRKDEVSRTEVEHGSAKHPGLDILMRHNGISTRKLAVGAGSRVYLLSVASKNEELLKSDRVKEFFGSLDIGK